MLKFLYDLLVIIIVGIIVGTIAGIAGGIFMLMLLIGLVFFIL